MSTSPTLKAFFEPKTLSQLGIRGHILTPAIRYQDTKVDKIGMAKWLSYVPKIGGKPSLSLDLDLACVVLDKAGKAIEHINYGNIRNQNASIRHGGDALVGSDSFAEKFINQEEINVHLDKLPQEAHHLIFVIKSHSKHALSFANKGICTLRDNDGILAHDVELHTLPKDCSAVIAWHLQRQPATLLDGVHDEWLLHAPFKPLIHGDMDDVLQQACDAFGKFGNRW